MINRIGKSNVETLLSNSSIATNSTFVLTTGYNSMMISLSFNSSVSVTWTPTIYGYMSTGDKDLQIYDLNTTGVALGTSALTVGRMISITGLPEYIKLSVVPSSSPLTEGLLTAKYQLYNK